MQSRIPNLRIAGSAVDDIVAALLALLDAGSVPPGVRMPSVRALAEQQGISRYAVVEAYERLVALGRLVARRGSGFYACDPPRGSAPGRRPEASAFDVAQLIRRVLEDDSGALRVGGPWMPDDWLDPSTLQTVIRSLARRPGGVYLQYGHPLGYAPLRHQLQRLLAEIGIRADTNQILLTTGTSQALDLITRHLLIPGDVVMVDDPGYYNLFAYLRWYGVRLVEVPRQPDGPDMHALRACAAAHRPKVYYTQTVLQNPTGSSMSLGVMHRVLSAAAEFGFHIVEDDTYNDLDPAAGPRLATLDGFERVTYVRSFSKTVSGSFRVGCIVANLATIDDLVRAKLLTAITSSQFNEMVVHQLLAEGHYRKFLDRLRLRIEAAIGDTVEAFTALGLEIFCRPTGANFVWARLPAVEDSATLQPCADRHGVILAHGAVFRPHLQPSPWMRFNVALCDDPRLMRFLRDASTKHIPQRAERND